MKKYISLIICSVFIVIACFIGAFETSDVVCGSGNGRDYSVSTIEQFFDVLAFFNDNEKTSTIEKKNESRLKRLVRSMADSTESSAFSSVTLYDKAKLVMSVSGGVYDLSATATGYTYLTQTETYVKQQGTILQKTNTSSVIAVDIDFELYINNEEVYVKYNKYDYSASGEADDNFNNYIDYLLDKWFLYDVEGGNQPFLEFNSQFKNCYEALGTYFHAYTSNFKKSSNVYTVKDEFLNDLLCYVYNVESDNINNGELEINLSNKTKPSLKICTSCDYEIDGGKHSEDVTYYVEQYTVFSNINNTVIQFNPDKKYSLTEYMNENINSIENYRIENYNNEGAAR